MHTSFESVERKIYISYYEESHSFRPHFHGKIEIAYCFEGAMKIKIGEELYVLKKGDAAVIFPNVSHEYIKNEESKNTKSIVIISKTELLSGVFSGLTSKTLRCPVVHGEDLKKETHRCFHKVKSHKGEAELVGWTMIILSDIMEKLELVSVKDTDGFSLAPRVVKYIEENFKSPLTIKQLAKEFGYSESYIAHIFHDQLKIPFRTLLGQLRSEYAANLIDTKNMRIGDIAYECGYESVNTFCRCFKRCFGKTPSEYKKLKRNMKQK